MKNKIIIIALAGVILSLNACMGGDHNPQGGKDPKDVYGTAKDTTSKIDTAKITSPDHSASGGTDLVKDTAKKK